MTDKTATKPARRFARMPGGSAATDPVSAAPKAVDPAPCPESKVALVTRLLQRAEGATLPDLVEVTGWLPHTTRAALTGLKKRARSSPRASAMM